jgi:cell division protease FtsH
VQDNKNQQEDNRGPQINPNVLRFYILGFVIIMVLNFVIIPKIAESRVLTSSYSEFRHMIEDDRVKEVSFDENQIMFIALNEDGVKRVYKTGLMDDPDIIQLMEEKNINYAATIPEQPNAFFIFSSYMGCSHPVLYFPAPCDE